MIEGHRVILRETRQSHSSKGINAMTTAHDIDLPAVLADRLTTTHPDVLRELLATFIHTLMGAEADPLCGAGYGERSTERTSSRNGYRHRQFDTRTGTFDLAVHKLRQGSYFPDTPVWAIVGILFVSGAFRSIGFTAYNSLAFADVESHELTHANTVNAAVRELAAGVGIALASLAVALFTPLASAGGHGTSCAYSWTYLSWACLRCRRQSRPYGFLLTLACSSLIRRPRAAIAELRYLEVSSSVDLLT
jgi:hypothetical protein